MLCDIPNAHTLKAYYQIQHPLSGQIKHSTGMSTHMNGKYVCKKSLRTNTLQIQTKKVRINSYYHTYK